MDLFKVYKDGSELRYPNIKGKYGVKLYIVPD